jgi:uncharacterized protein with NAD-binding domain and iron-sulfur cluster
VRRHRRSVAILGGGVAGLTAAHELAERGFAVTVYERKALGGKARSMPVPHSARGGRAPLPGEHGYRICIGTYQYLPDSLRRIPFGASGKSVYDNLVKGGDVLVARASGRENLRLFVTGPVPPLSIESALGQLVGLLEFATGARPQELGLLVRRLLVYFTSCDQRRFGEWEYVSMWDFMQADGKSPEYQRILTDYLSHLIQSTPARIASARAHMNLWEAVAYCAAGQGDSGRPFIELLNAPTNTAWIDPWVRYLTSLGARFHVGATVEELSLSRGRVCAVRVRDRRGRRHSIEADYFVLAVPVERAQRLLRPAVLAADPALEALREIQTRWMNGIQFYLRRPVDINRGHVAYVDSPWVVSSVSQAQFWPVSFVDTYGDGQARDCLSAIASEWRQPGILYGKAARHCTPEEIASEVWAQMKAALTGPGKPGLSDDDLHSWFIDPAIQSRSAPPAGTRSDEPLFIETPGLWDQRPEAATAIPNLFLAADYVRNGSPIDAATMDGANAAARAAVNALLERSNSKTALATTFARYTAPELRAAKELDARRYAHGLPNLLDTGPPTVGLADVEASVRRLLEEPLRP